MQSNLCSRALLKTNQQSASVMGWIVSYKSWSPNQLPSVNVTSIANKVFADLIELKIRSSEWCPIQYDWCPHKKRETWTHTQWGIPLPSKDTDTWGKMVMFRKRLRWEWCIYKSRNVKDCWQILEAGRSKERLIPTGFRGSMALLTPWLWTSSLQNCGE